jgi:putative nucleotidyltransferase with HDIG domain
VEPPGDPAFPLLRQAAGDLGARAWVVGGYVRDQLLGRDHPDLDVVAEEGRAADLAARFAELAGARPPVVFPRFGTAQVTWNDRQFEFVSARSESYQRSSRKPSVRPATIDEDLRRRDFTVNTMLMDLDGRIHDPLGGRADLDRRLLRTPDDPARTFDDDPLRMLRGVRFVAELGFSLDPPLLEVLRQLRERLRPPVISVERIADELRKMLLSPRPARALEVLDEGGLLEVVLPELAACRGVLQGGWHTADVFGHTLETVARTPSDLEIRLAALLHDVGKPATAAPDGSFHRHEEVGAGLAEEALARLRFPVALTANVARLVRLHLRPVYYEAAWGDGAVRRLARDAGDLVDPLLALARADIGASAYPHPEKLDELADRLRRVREEQPSRLRLPVTGRDIMRVRGLRPGPDVGRLKSHLEDLVLEGTLLPDRDAILEYLRRGEGGEG